MNKKIALAVIVTALLVSAGCVAWLLTNRADKPEPIPDTTLQQQTEQQTDAAEVEHIVFADSFSIPAADELNVFSFIQTVEAMQLKTLVEHYFGIDSLVSTENTIDQFFDSRGTDKNGSDITFQQNINSGSFIYSATFSVENSKAFKAAYKTSQLDSKRAELEAQANKIAEDFKIVTGELVLESVEKTPYSNAVETADNGMPEYYEYDALQFTYKRKTAITVEAAKGIECDENVNDRFVVLLRPDSQVISISSALSCAPMEIIGSEKMFTLAQLKAYEQSMIDSMYEGEGAELMTKNYQRTYTACRLAYTNDHTVGKYVPGVVLTYYDSDAPDEKVEEYCPISFARDGFFS